MFVLAASAFTFALKAEAKGCCCPSHTSSMKPRFYLDAGVGNAFDSQVDSDSVAILFLGENITYSLSATNHAYPNNLAIGAGCLWPQPYQANSPYFPFLSLGLQYQYTNFDSKKTFMSFSIFLDDQKGPFDDGSHYIFSQNSLLANLKLDLYRWNRVMPYVNLGLGASWNQAKAQGPFTDNSDDPEAFIIGTGRSTAFSYTVGAGLDFLVTERFWLSLGYSYNNFGHVQLGKITYTTNPNNAPAPFTFNLRNLTTHNIQLTGRYVFG